MREIQKYRYAVAAILTIIMFTMGVLVSNFADDTRARSLNNQMRQDLAELESRQLQLSYLKSGEVESCDVLEAGLENIVSGYNQRLGRVQQYQDSSLVQADRFQTIKHRYIISGIRYWIFAEELRERCDYSTDTVLFFTNRLDKQNCEECERVGRQLTLLKKQRDGRLLVFSIPTEMEDGMVDILERRYNVTETPSVVVNGEEKIEGHASRNAIAAELDRSGG